MTLNASPFDNIAFDDIAFDGRIVLLGHGSVGQCILPMLLQSLGLPPERIVVTEADDSSGMLSQYRAEGLTYRQRRITPDNLAQTMAGLARPGDLLLNLSVGVDSIALASWCVAHGVRYIDTAIEPWEDFAWTPSTPAAERTEYALHQAARRRGARWPQGAPTAIFTHGANPGLVSHFAKAALLDLAAALGRESLVPAERAGWAALSRDLGVKVIHISERDTQRSDRPRRPGEFVNTWSIAGFLEESVMPSEVGWGTHERTLPPDGGTHAEGPCNAIYIARPAAGVMLRSWVPLGGQILGLALPHSECVTLSEYLTVEEGGRATYRPTVAFVYLACDDAMASLHEARMHDWRPLPEERILNQEIVEGRDELGVLLLGHDLTGWWYGSQLDIAEARRIVPHSNPTAMQVAAGMLGAAVWALRNPDRGYCEPEDLPHAEVLAAAAPYLGPKVSQATSWTPLAGRQLLFPEPGLDHDDPWQFGNFLAG